MKQKEDTYQAYMLRFQRGSIETSWRISLENAHTGELIRFRSKKELFRYFGEMFADMPEDKTNINLS